MYTHTLKKLAKNTVEILVDIPKSTVENEYKSSFSALNKNLQVEGFRKGKVPADIAQKRISKELVFEELVKHLIPKIYEEIVKKESLKPIISPKVDLVKAKEGMDWQIKITVAQKPVVDLGNYKSVLKKIKDDQKKTEIWTPGKESKEKKAEPEQEAKVKQELLNKILEGLLKECKVEIPDLVVDEELNKRLTNLLTDIQKIGLTVDSYLKSKNITQEELKNRYKREIEDTYKLEFILIELADKENITVEKSDLEKILASMSDPKEKEAAKANSYFYASLLRKQKTLDYLLDL